MRFYIWPRGIMPFRCRCGAAGELALLAEAFNLMADKLKHFHDMNIDQILAEKRKSEAIIRSVDDGLVVVDEKLLITNLNPKATAIFQGRPGGGAG